jgi:hypothetical protein
VLLEKYIREILLESNKGQLSLLSVIDYIVDINSKGSDFKVWLYDAGNKIRIGYDDEKKESYSVGSDMSKEIYGYIELSSYGRKAKAKGEKNSAWFVSGVRAKKSLGLGSLLYEVAIEYISIKKLASIMPDPNFVSVDAKRMWNNLDARSDILKLQLDIHKNRLRSLKKELNDDSLSQLTSDYDADDILMSAAIKDKGRDWQQSVLSRAYKKTNYDIINSLKSKNLISFIDELQ